MWNNLKGGFAYITALFIDLFVFQLLLYISNSHLIRLFPPPTMFLILLCGLRFNVIRAWQRQSTNNNQNDLTNAIWRLDFQKLFNECFVRLDLVIVTIFQYAIIFYLIGGGIFIHKYSATSIAVSINSEYSKRVIVVDVCFCNNHFMTPCKYSFQSMIKGKSPI